MDFKEKKVKTMVFDPTITFGNIATLLGFLTGGVWFVWEMRTKLLLIANAHSTLALRLDKIDTELAALAKTAVEIARQDERLNAQDIRMQELSNRLDSCQKVIKSRAKR